MMYNDVDNDLPSFNDTIDGDDGIFLFSTAKTSSNSAPSFLVEDDDEHLRHQHNVVDCELLLNNNFLDQSDPLFWNCNDIDHLNYAMRGQLQMPSHLQPQPHIHQQTQQPIETIPEPPLKKESTLDNNNKTKISVPATTLAIPTTPIAVPSTAVPIPSTTVSIQANPVALPAIPVGFQSTTISFPAHSIGITAPITLAVPPVTTVAVSQATTVAVSATSTTTTNSVDLISSSNNIQNNIITSDGVSKQKDAALKQQKAKEKQTKLDCPYCKRSFSKNFDLQQHMRCHTGEKPFQCIVCGRGFAQKSNVKKHMQAHKVWPEGPNHPLPSIHVESRSRNNSASSSMGTPRDDECMQENDSLQFNNNGIPLGLSNDKKNDANDLFAENRYSCSYCTFNGRTYFELKSHLTIHKREKVFKCIVSSCGKTFPGNELQNFLSHVTGHKDLIYHCYLCSGQFYSLDEFGEHQKHHSNSQQKGSSQQQPGQPSASVMVLNNQQSNNITSSSLRQQQYQLVTSTQLQPQQKQRQFNQQSPTQQQLNNQQIAKETQLFSNQPPQKNNQKFFRCTKCMNKYTTQIALDHHLSISTHNFPCTECNKVFMCKRYLRRHLNTHTTVQHVCTFCDKQFKTAAYLKMHSVVHTGEKPFRCNLCEAAFNRRDKLNRHKLTHETIKKFKCPFKPHIGCTKEFNRPDKLKAHVLTHSGFRPHPCDSCSRTFSRLSRLREHKKLHHNSNSLNLKPTIGGTELKEEPISSSQMIAIEIASGTSGSFSLA